METKYEMTPTVHVILDEKFELTGPCLDTSPQQSRRTHVEATPITPVQETVQGASGSAELANYRGVRTQDNRS